MKGIAILAAAAALVSLAGCDKVMPTNATANAATGNSAAPAANTAAPQTADAAKPSSTGGAVPAASTGPVPLDRTYMMGRWTDDGNCNNAIEFSQDGGFRAAGGGTGLWNLEGDRLTMTGRQTATIRIVVIDQNTMTVINGDGSLGRSTRC